MKLTRLELSGFKSFATTANLPFEDGVTSIVGPNGCGKSNISDAVRWVLGEQRVRLLRGAKMDEVIFQGSAKRRPVNLAEVSLYLDNSDGALPVSFNEVVITRRLSRNGQSDYLVNQSSIRLRDLQDLLKGTGLGSDVGVVIEAQMIDRLLSDKPDERRSMFEEAAGIGLYRDRKENTERKLDKTLEDLRRLDDLISEVQTQVRSLARQRGKAERYEKFAAERFAIVMTLTRRTLAKMSDEESDLRTRRRELDERIPQARERLVTLERSREQSIQSRATQEARRTELERRLAEARLEVGRLEGELKVASERLEHAAGRKTRAVEERRLAAERAKQAEREREAAATERTAAAAARESVQTELNLRSTSEEEVRGQLTMQRELVRDLEDKLQRQAETSRALAGEQVAVEADVEDLKRLAAEAEERCRECAREFDTARQRVDATRAEWEQRQRQAQAATNELHRARHNLAAAREHEAAIRVQRRAAEEQIAQRAARRKALEALETEREGLAPAARELLRQRERFGDAILGPLSDYVRTSQADARTAENLLAEWLHAVLVRDEQAVDDVRRWHAESAPGPLVLLPVSAAPNGGDGTETLDIDVRSPAEGWVRSLLSGITTLGAGGDAVRRANGAIFLPGPGTGGPLSRRAELDALVREVTAAERERDQLIRTAERAAREHEQAERALEAAAEAAEAARASLRETETSADEADRHSHRIERDKIEADETLARLTQRREQRHARLEQIAEELSAGGKERDRLMTDLERQRATLREIEEAQEAARERRVHWQVEEAQVSAREEAAQQRESRASEILAEAQTAMTALDSELASIDEDTGAISTKQARWNEALHEKRVEVEQMRRAASGAETAVLEADRTVERADEELANAREALERLNEESHRIDLSLTEGAGHRHALVERIEAEWHKPLADLLERAEDVDGDTEILEEEAERLARTLETLGPVNPLAVQEHAEETKRLEFLTEQREDLVEARTSLLKALREIEETARQLFLESFAQIRKNFHAVFQTLFEGGECDVRLESEADPLDSAIDIFAAPRGKRVQRIHLLSSGERALVALSLLFSIYLTKPAPFCLLDEVDAPLDDANVIRFVRLLEEFKADTQFIVITHNPRTMQVADAVYGVTMQEPGISTIVGVRLGEAEALAS